jgi:Asp-tRNA(Asn)/Glu-tRNA(Gln) amidotransferase A subunit family amidase
LDNRFADGSVTDMIRYSEPCDTVIDIAGDTRASIQCPAAFCGVFGLRPTEHRVPLTGTIFIDLIRKFRVLATAGPMARSVEDLRLAMQVIAGPDGRDPEVPPVSWRDTAPVELTGCVSATRPSTRRSWMGRSGPARTRWLRNCRIWA